MKLDSFDRISLDDAQVTMDSFGSDCPANWEEIAEYMNEKISALPQDEDGFVSSDDVDLIWQSFWEDLPIAPIAYDDAITLENVRDCACSLYDGGWRPGDADEMAHNYPEMTKADIAAVCEALADIEAENERTTRIYVAQRDVTRAAGCVFDIGYFFTEEEAIHAVRSEYAGLCDYDRRNVERWFVEGWDALTCCGDVDGMNAKEIWDAGVEYDADQFCTDAAVYIDLDPAAEEAPEGYWYAVLIDRDDDDWSEGSYDLDEARRKLARLKADGYDEAYIAVIDNNTTNPVCVEEIHE